MEPRFVPTVYRYQEEYSVTLTDGGVQNLPEQGGVLARHILMAWLLVVKRLGEALIPGDMHIRFLASKAPREWLNFDVLAGWRSWCITVS